MKHIVIGAGQIATALVRELEALGHEPVIFRASPRPVPGVRTIHGDILDSPRLAEEVLTAAAVHHCLHTTYDHRAWRAELPRRERAVMDCAAAAGVPVVFPESVYAFGAAAEFLAEGAPLDPCSPLGEVRAELLDARASHPAQTVSVVASDLFGPTANDGSVATATILRPIAAGRRAWVPADLDVTHAWTYLPDLARAMIAATAHRERFTDNSGSADLVLNSPSPAPRSCRGLAHDAARLAGTSPRISSVPQSLVAAGGVASATLRELHAQRYLWLQPSVLIPGALTTLLGLRPTGWDEALPRAMAPHTSPSVHAS